MGRVNLTRPGHRVRQNRQRASLGHLLILREVVTVASISPQVLGVLQQRRPDATGDLVSRLKNHVRIAWPASNGAMLVASLAITGGLQ